MEDIAVLRAKVNVLEQEVSRLTAQRDEANGRVEKLRRKKDAEIVELQGKLDRAMEVVGDNNAEVI